jgi:GTP:adenosylcobinamide-phosphate guanylyltransferase
LTQKQEQRYLVDALVLAGGDGEVVDPAVPVKGLVAIAGRPMVQWVLEALRAAQTVRRIALVIPSGHDLGDWTELVDIIVHADDEFAENITAGVEALPRDLNIIGVTSDIPMLTPEAVDDLVTQTADRGAALSYPLIREEDILAQYPGSQRTFVKIKSGKVTGGNAMVFSPEVFLRLQEFAQEMFLARKNPLKMARIVGPIFATKLVAGQLDPADVEKKLSKLIGAPCAAIYTSYASIGADVDKPADIPPAEAALQLRSS